MFHACTFLFHTSNPSHALPSSTRRPLHTLCYNISLSPAHKPSSSVHLTVSSHTGDTPESRSPARQGEAISRRPPPPHCRREGRRSHNGAWSRPCVRLMASLIRCCRRVGRRSGRGRLQTWSRQGRTVLLG
jgi:hypothetical protein